MSVERWEKIESAYHTARDLRQEDRSRFLDEQCGSDAAIRQQIEALLAQDENLTSFLNRPAVHFVNDLRSISGTMPGLTGLRVGGYEVLEPIGSGGMGEVYRARDTKLGRDVALKTLPQLLALDADRLARFEREAQVLASLNHPNIAAIYGFEELILAASSGHSVVRALALELVEGPTLADRIAQGPIPVDDVISIARQIADALAAAHERGIIHRDLKPANIKLRPDGLVKVLDFGIAKVLEPVDVVADNSSPTGSPAATEVGVILGTAAYMSPEQAKGRPTEKRSDVWAFGCVLYEMLTGTRAFPGEDVSDTLAAVLRGEPDWSRLPAAVPPAIRTLIEGCLQKDRKQSIADISAARFLMGERQTRATVPAPMTAPSQSFWRHALPFAATAAVAAALAGIVAWSVGSSPFNATNARAVRFVVAPPRGTSYGTREEPITPSLSPDGTRLVFRVLRQGEPVLAVRAIDALDAQVLTGTEGARFPFWSPDSRVIAFFAGGKLRTIGAAGGPLQTICDAAPGFGGTWSRQGLIAFAPGPTQGLFKVPATGGQPSPLTNLQKNEIIHRLPQFLPDGQRFLYSAEPNALYLGSIDGRPSVRVPLATNLAAQYAPSGYLLFIQDGALLAQRFDPDGARFTGDPVQIGESLQGLQRLGETVSTSDTGVLAYAMDPSVNVRLAWVDRAGRSVGSVGPFPFGHYADRELSPQGNQLAVTSVPAPRTTAAPWANQDVWVFDLEHGRSTQLTFDSASDEHPIWSPDGRQLVFLSRRQGAEGLYQKAANNEKPEELLLRGTGLLPLDWSAAGILYDSGGPAADLWLLPLDGDRKPYALVREPFTQSDAQFSPDGRWFAYSSAELGRPEVFVQRFPPSGAKSRISINGGSHPRWRRDGKELFYLAADGKLMAVPVASDRNTFRADVSRELFQTGLNSLYPRIRSYGVSPDGERFLISLSEDPGTTASIVVVFNWPAALKP